MKLYKKTVSPVLWDVLGRLMGLESLSEFRLVGGTSLSLQIGHRVSIDIDLFTDAAYRSIDFKSILKNLQSHFPSIEHNGWKNETVGNSCFIGNSEEEWIKLDLFYTEPFQFPFKIVEGLRLAKLEDIATMKLDVIGRGGRKKDFWDIHALLDHFELTEMLELYAERYPYRFSTEELLVRLTDFQNADHDPPPNCLAGKYWELIQLDLEEQVMNFGL